MVLSKILIYQLFIKIENIKFAKKERPPWQLGKFLKIALFFF